MGSFFDNIHLRTTERDRVEHVWAEYWRARGEESLVWISPPYGNWISLFDWKCDQQNIDILIELSAHLSRELGCPTLAFQVQDSDLAEYWLFEQGKKADHYTSNQHYYPSYLDKEAPATEGVYSGYGPDTQAGYPSEEDNTNGGNTGLLKSITGAAVDDVELEAILRTPATFADDILTALASAIGINDIWASVGYHYLVTEGDTIPGIDHFKHLPTEKPPNPQWFEEQN